MGDHLEQAARFSKSRESTLNVSDSVSFISTTVMLLPLLMVTYYYYYCTG